MRHKGNKLKSGGIIHHDLYCNFILFSFMVAFVSTLGVFLNVANEQLQVKSMNLGKSMEVMLNH